MSTSNISSGTRILVTGVNGLVGSHVADQLLIHGFNVVGTVRDTEKHAWISGLFGQRFGDGRFELRQVTDMTEDGAFGEAIKGVAGVVHVASVLTGFEDPNEFIDTVIKTNENLLMAAKKEKSVRSFIYTSSTAAATYTTMGGLGEPITSDTWNEKAIHDVKTQYSDTANGWFSVYCASKALGEQAVWKWVQENKPQFTTNTVLPSVCFGPSISPENQGFPSSSAWPVALFQNNLEPLKPFIDHMIPHGTYTVNVQDVARLHVAPLLDPTIKQERIFASGAPFSWTQIVNTLQSLFPSHEFAQFPDDENLKHADIEPSGRAEGLLRDMGRDGWTPLEETLRANVEHFI